MREHFVLLDVDGDVVGGATDVVVVFNNRHDILPLSLPPFFSTLIVCLTVSLLYALTQTIMIISLSVN